MTRQDLEQIKDLRVEVVELAAEIAKASQEHVTDVVMGSRHAMPYDLHTIVVEGIDSCKVLQLRLNLSITCAKLQDQLCNLEEWIESIQDSETRSVIRMYYQQGLTQEAIGQKIGYSRQRIGQKLEAFLSGLKD